MDSQTKDGYGLTLQVSPHTYNVVNSGLPGSGAGAGPSAGMNDLWTQLWNQLASIFVTNTNTNASQPMPTKGPNNAFKVEPKADSETLDETQNVN